MVLNAGVQNNILVSISGGDVMWVL